MQVFFLEMLIEKIPSTRELTYLNKLHITLLSGVHCLLERSLLEANP